jgi:beta-N-acetylhexosaminidase
VVTNVRKFAGIGLLLMVTAWGALTPMPSVRAQGDRVDTLLRGMTLEQKVAQMFLVGIFGSTLNEPNRILLETWQPGGAVLFVSNVGQPDAVTRLINDWQGTIVDLGGVPMFVATDQEGGVIARLKDGFTTFPAMMLLTATGDVSMAYRTGEALARELSAVGVNMNLAPVADLYTNLRNPIIGRRSFGSEPEATGQMLAALIRGMQAGGVMATAKHFPGHGDTALDSHTALPVVDYPLEELERIELSPFRWTVASGVEAVMVAHIWYPALDPQDETPASLSHNVITGLLRERMGFTGLVMTDAIEMDAIDTRLSYAEASIQAIEAGVDLVAFGAHLSPQTQSDAMQTVVDAVRSGRLSAARIDESVRRILDAKLRYGVLDWQPLDASQAAARVDAPAGAALVQDIFRAGVTLAYDQTGMIPLNPARTVAVIYPASRPSIRTQCERPGWPVEWVGVAESPSDNDIARAGQAARRADGAVVFTINAGSDPTQQALVNALPPEKTAAVALFSPFDWVAFPGVSAFITTYSPLAEGVPAACAVLFGDQTARGRLPVALDGARIFQNGGALIADGVALALLPRQADQVPLPTVPLDATRIAQVVASTALPTEAPLPSPTLEPLSAEQRPTRDPLLSVAVASETSQPSLTATDSPAPATQIAAVIPTLSRSTPTNTTSGSPTSTDFTPLMLPLALVGAFSALYGGLYARGARLVGRLSRGAVVSHCLVCGESDLELRARAKRTLGIPGARVLVTCPHCGSTLRHERGDLWRYRISEHVNPRLYARLNNRLVDEKTLRLLERERV